MRFFLHSIILVFSRDVLAAIFFFFKIKIKDYDLIRLLPINSLYTNNLHMLTTNESAPHCAGGENINKRLYEYAIMFMLQLQQSKCIINNNVYLVGT